MVNSYYECRFKELFLYSLQALVKQSTEAAYFPRFFMTSSITKIQYINNTVKSSISGLRRYDVECFGIFNFL